MLTVGSAQNIQAKQSDTFNGPSSDECRCHDYGFSLLRPREQYILKECGVFYQVLSYAGFPLTLFPGTP